MKNNSMTSLNLSARVDSISEVKTDSGYTGSGSASQCYAYYIRKREADITVSTECKKDAPLLRKLIYETTSTIIEQVDSGYSYLEVIPLSDVKKGDDIQLVLEVNNDFIENLKKAHTLFFSNKPYRRTPGWPSIEDGYVMTNNLKLFVKVTQPPYR